MPKRIAPLSDAKVKSLAKTPGIHAVGGIAGLLLQVTPTADGAATTASWILRRRTPDGKRPMLGLGSAAEITLAAARAKAGAMISGATAAGSAVLISQRREARRQAAVQSAAAHAAMTFDQAKVDCIAAKRHSWTNAKSESQWTNTLTRYASKVLGHLEVGDIQASHVADVLRPIWAEKHETASRVRERIEAVIAYADRMAGRERANPARWENNLEHIFTGQTKGQKAKKRFPSLPYTRLPEFWADLQRDQGTSARALSLAIMCASRSSEVRFATRREFDLEAGMWTIPAERMKERAEHRVPLTKPALELLRALPEGKPGDLLFSGRDGKALSEAALLQVVMRINERRDRAGLAKFVDPKLDDRAVVPHGFRSTFSTFIGERTEYPAEMREFALAHAIDNQVKASYLRTDMVEKRRRMMSDWQAHCMSGGRGPAKVVAIGKAAKA